MRYGDTRIASLSRLSYTVFPPVLFCMQFLLLLHLLHRFIVARVITTILHLSLGYPCYPPLIRVQSATDDNQLQRRVFSGDSIFHHFVSPSPKLTQGSLPLDPLSLEHDVCGLNYSSGSARNPGSRFKGSACLAQSLPRRHRLRRSQDLTEGTLLNGRRTRNDLEDWCATMARNSRFSVPRICVATSDFE